MAQSDSARACVLPAVITQFLLLTDKWLNGVLRPLASDRPRRSDLEK
jgi:hypothetical protein